MSKRQVGGLVALLSVIVFLSASVIEQKAEDTIAVLVGAAVTAALLVVTKNIFVRKAALHSPYLYYVALSLALALGFLVYTVLEPSPLLSSWSVRLLVGVIVSISIILPYLLLARLMKVNTLPWERDNGGGSHRS